MPKRGDAGRVAPITATIKDFCVLSGLCRTQVYNMLRDGKIRGVKIGIRRLIVLDSYRDLLHQLASKENYTRNPTHNSAVDEGEHMVDTCRTAPAREKRLSPGKSYEILFKDKDFWGR